LESRLIATHLYEIQIDVVELEAFPTRGGAIEPLGDKLLVATPRGRLALIDDAGRVAYLPQRVPMNESASEGPILWTGFRVADILLQKREQNRYTLFASHHYFAGSCVEFRISSVSLLIDDSDVSLSGEWKTEFTANPCIDNDIFDFGHRGGIQAGGRMLMDGVVSDSRQFPLWRGDLLIASLFTQSLYRTRLRQGHVMYVEKIEIGARIRDITQLPDGRFALLTDSARVLFLQRAPNILPERK